MAKPLTVVISLVSVFMMMKQWSSDYRKRHRQDPQDAISRPGSVDSKIYIECIISSILTLDDGHPISAITYLERVGVDHAEAREIAYRTVDLVKSLIYSTVPQIHVAQMEHSQFDITDSADLMLTIPDAGVKSW